MLKEEFLWWVVVQTDFHVKPTTKLLWVAVGLGWVAVAWLGFGVMTTYLA